MDALIGRKLFARLIPIDYLFPCARLAISLSRSTGQSTLSVNLIDESHIRYVTKRPYIKNNVLFSRLDWS